MATLIDTRFYVADIMLGDSIRSATDRSGNETLRIVTPRSGVSFHCYNCGNIFIRLMEQGNTTKQNILFFVIERKTELMVKLGKTN